MLRLLLNVLMARRFQCLSYMLNWLMCHHEAARSLWRE